ncbi:hypothetical protein DY000_02016998 [Brassica cretica]|uniref:Uncharacterized protein n=1 Tax=Brassica cretica TaxID=69181 RepID=A0ABQ7CSL4_BRACR|nr:hypothetical protein DY000_02016998 [Brassica cretica]
MFHIVTSGRCTTVDGLGRRRRSNGRTLYGHACGVFSRHNERREWAWCKEMAIHASYEIGTCFWTQARP